MAMIDAAALDRPEHTDEEDSGDQRERIRQHVPVTELARRQEPDRAGRHRHERPRDTDQPSAGARTRQITNAGLDPQLATHLLVATCRARPVVRPPVVETADPE